MKKRVAFIFLLFILGVILFYSFFFMHSLGEKKDLLNTSSPLPSVEERITSLRESWVGNASFSSSKECTWCFRHTCFTTTCEKYANITLLFIPGCPVSNFTSYRGIVIKHDLLDLTYRPSRGIPGDNLTLIFDTRQKPMRMLLLVCDGQRMAIWDETSDSFFKSRRPLPEGFLRGGYP